MATKELNADGKYTVILTEKQRVSAYHALETQIGVVKRRRNVEKSEAIREILDADIAFLTDLSRMFFL